MSNQEFECPICYNNVSNYVNFECCHKVCLECYFNQLLHSMNTCSLCRNNIKLMDNSIEKVIEMKEVIIDLEEEVDDLDLDIDDLIKRNIELEEQLLCIERYNMELIDKNERLQNEQFLMIGNCEEY